MYKCIKAFYTANMEKWYYGMRMHLHQFKNLTQKEQANFVLEVEPTQREQEMFAGNTEINPNADSSPNEFQGYNSGSSEGGGASGEY